MIGAAWRDLAAELEESLREDDPSAQIKPWVDASGCLRFRVIGGPRLRHTARIKVRDFESKAASTCETCGGEVGQTRAAPGMAVYLCPDCVPD